ncbi:MAG: hypothetical protein F6K41_28825 [Symploca sp. SIO3E6]|nr:hypothetical protein [Caldora sp. SIO3E6]
MSKRIQVTLPDRLADDLQRWADYDGRPLSNLAAFLLEKIVFEAKSKGVQWDDQKKEQLKPKEMRAESK